ARADRGVVPVVDAVAVEIGLADLGPVLGLVRGGVGVLPQPLAGGGAVGVAQARAPGGVDPAPGGVGGVAERVDGDALVVVGMDGQVEQVFLAEAGDAEAAGAADPLVLVLRVRAVAVLGHVGVNLVLADDDEARAVLDHGLEDVGPAGQ